MDKRESKAIMIEAALKAFKKGDVDYMFIYTTGNSTPYHFSEKPTFDKKSNCLFNENNGLYIDCDTISVIELR